MWSFVLPYGRIYVTWEDLHTMSPIPFGVVGSLYFLMGVHGSKGQKLVLVIEEETIQELHSQDPPFLHKH